MNIETLAIAIDMVGWGLWAILTRQLAGKGLERWISVDYYLSTLLLAASTACTAASLVLSQPELFARVAVPVALGGMAILIGRKLRNGARTLRMQYTSSTQAVDAATAPAAQRSWRTVTTPPPSRAPRGAGSLFSDPLIRDIEARRAI